MESLAVLKIPVAVVALCCSATLARSDALQDCQQNKDRDRQIAACTQIIRTDPKNAGAFFNRGVAHWAKSEDDFSIGDDSRALLVNPRGIVYSWGLLYAGKGTNAEAIADFTRAIAINPKLVAAYVFRGRVYAADNGRGAEARADFTKAIALVPDNADAYFYRGSISGDDGIADLGRAIALNPELAAAYNNRGVQRLDNDEAIADYQKAIELVPKYAVGLSDLGVALWGHKQFDNAMAKFNEAIALEPRTSIAYVNRAGLFLVLGKKDEAIADYKIALTIKTSAQLAADLLRALGVPEPGLGYPYR